MTTVGIAFRRVYVDIPAAVANKLDDLAKQSGTSKKNFLANLIIREAERHTARKRRERGEDE